jgi:hypothetical protein
VSLRAPAEPERCDHTSQLPAPPRAVPGAGTGGTVTVLSLSAAAAAAALPPSLRLVAARIRVPSCHWHPAAQALPGAGAGVYESCFDLHGPSLSLAAAAPPPPRSLLRRSAAVGQVAPLRAAAAGRPARDSAVMISDQ